MLQGVWPIREWGHHISLGPMGGMEWCYRGCGLLWNGVIALHSDLWVVWRGVKGVWFIRELISEKIV